jgi:predicted transcriptional regulator
MTIPPPKKPKLLYDKEGNVILNKFGHPVTAELTSEDKENINKLASKGYSKRAIADELGVSLTRLTNYLKEPAIANAIALMAYVEETAAHNKKMEAAMMDMLSIITKLESRVSNIQTELQQTKKAAARNRIGREKAERTSRSQRQQLTQLKKQLWKRTGLKPG